MGGVITDGAGRVFLHRRTADRELLPGAWDIAGGHVEPGESVLDALAREIEEETGWRLERVLADLGCITWTDAGREIREVDYVVTVSGDLNAPRLEAGKHDAWRWIEASDLDILRKSRRKGDQLLHAVVERAFRWLAGGGGPSAAATRASYS